MARLTRGGFLAIAALFHLIYTYSIFEIYFVSPIVSGMRPFGVEGQAAPAKRLFLFVGDGLRADKTFQSFPDPALDAGNSTEALRPRPLAPFLRSRVLEHGTFGVSHTRVPTESRPGHVAMIAGLYEDVSAVTTGWQLNPVNFDSVFNRSRHTWSWGSPDICPMFKEGAVPGRVDSITYPPHYEDSSKDQTILDTWVFDRVKAMFAKAKTDSELDTQLRQDKNVFFLHLLGLDSTGHASRPYSKDYLRNIVLVDQGVKEITKLVEDFYGDGQTAFVFTADHGMSDWGSHGDGHPDNTRTPLIAWGSGVAKPVTVKAGKAPGHEDGFSSDWGLDHVQRHDVSQADIAALMAYLTGLEFPVNSVGELPLSFLTASPIEKAKAMLANTQGVLEMYKVKEQQKAANEIRFKPFQAFSGGNSSVESRVSEIEALIQEGEAERAIQQSTRLFKVALAGLRYLQTYDWLFLRTLVTAGYLGWMAFSLTTVIDLHVLNGSVEAKRSTASLVFFSSVAVILGAFLLARKSPWTYYAYSFFPVMFWEEVWARKSALLRGRKALFTQEGSFLGIVLKALAFFALLEALVQSYEYRQVYTFCYFLGTLWPLYHGQAFVKQNFVLVSTWVFSCISMGLFTLLPAVKVESLALMFVCPYDSAPAFAYIYSLLGGALMTAVGILYLLAERSLVAQGLKSLHAAALDKRLSRTIIGGQIGLIILSMIVTRSSVTNLQARKGLPLGTQVVGWGTLIASLIVPFLHSLRPNNDYIHRLVVLFLSFAPSFIILTISYEGLFYFAFFLTLVTWVRMEHRITTFTDTKPAVMGPRPTAAPIDSTQEPASTTNTTPTLAYRALTLSDARISLFFLFLLQSAFFSTGNIASVSSFSLDAVYRLIPVFDPFSQGALLMFKLLVPFALISANLGILNRRLGVAPSALFMIVTAMSDVLTLNFFWMVRDEGSWLEIGESISRFFIASLLCVFVAGLEGLSGVLIGGVEFDDDADHVEVVVDEKQEGLAKARVPNGLNGSSKNHVS